MVDSNARSGQTPPPRDQALAGGLERLAWLMDRAFVLPGTRVRVGLDALLGLLPIGGDLLTGIIQVGIVLVALGRYRVPQSVAARMMANVLLDISVGSIPLLGDLFDVAFKANTRNLRLLEPYLRGAGVDPGPSRPLGPLRSVSAPVGTPWGCLLAIALVLLAALALVLIGSITVVRWMVRS